jgi:hypothetical protein
MIIIQVGTQAKVGGIKQFKLLHISSVKFVFLEICKGDVPI